MQDLRKSSRVAEGKFRHFLRDIFDKLKALLRSERAVDEHDVFEHSPEPKRFDVDFHFTSPQL